MRMLIFCVRDAAERGSETDADAMLRSLLRIRKSGVIERHSRGSDGKLRVTVQAFQTMRRKIIFGNPFRNFTAAVRIERRSVEAADLPNATFLRAQSEPEIFPTDPNARDR